MKLFSYLLIFIFALASIVPEISYAESIPSSEKPVGEIGVTESEFAFAKSLLPYFLFSSVASLTYGIRTFSLSTCNFSLHFIALGALMSLVTIALGSSVYLLPAV